MKCGNPWKRGCLNPIPTGGVGERVGSRHASCADRLNPIPTGGVGELHPKTVVVTRHASQSHPHRRGG